MGVGLVEGFQVYFAEAYVEFCGDDGAEELAALAGMGCRRRKDVVAVELFVVDYSVVADLPDEVVGGLGAEPGLEDAADAEAAVLHTEELPRALQPKPELHETLFVVLDVYHEELDFEILNDN